MSQVDETIESWVLKVLDLSVKLQGDTHTEWQEAFATVVAIQSRGREIGPAFAIPLAALFFYLVFN